LDKQYSLTANYMKYINKSGPATLLGLLAAAGYAIGAEVDWSKLPEPAKKTGVTYAADIKPLFEASCVRCHSGEKAKGGVRLDSLEAVLKGGKEGKVVLAGKSRDSVLVRAVSQLDEENSMPPKFKPGQRGPGGPPPGGAGGPPPGGPGAGGPPPGGPGGAGGGKGGFGPPPKPFTVEEVALVRAWIDQGAK
jgi:hypothetical protein